MSTLVTDLRQFLEGVPVTSPNTPLKEVLEILSEGKSDRLAIVNREGYPIGAIRLSSLLDRALKVGQAILAVPTRAEESASDLFDRAIEDVRLCELSPSPIEPPIVLPAQLSVDRLQRYLNDDRPHLTYAVVDSDDRFLGLLDRYQLLRALLKNEVPTMDALTTPSPTASDPIPYQKKIRELTAQNSALVQQNQLKDELLAWIVHEFKTPLTSLSGLSHLLGDSRVGPLNSRQTNYTGHLSRSSNQLVKLVEQISDWTRLEQAELELKLSRVSIARVCVEAYRQASQERAEVAEVSFSLDIERGLESSIADELRLGQILEILLANALKFTPPPGQIGLQVRRWGDWLAFQVWDTGVGILASQQPLVFHRFQKLANPHTQQFEGTGLSLSIAQRLARLHGGDITFTSKEGRGSRFTLVIPRQESEDASESPSGFPINPIVLIAESNSETIEALSNGLASFGYRAIVARSGLDALEKARTLKPHTLFVNPELPFLSGRELLTLLGTRQETRNLRAIAIVAEAERKQKPLDRVDGYLNLPVRVWALQKVMSVPVTQSAPGKLTVLWLIQNSEDENSPAITTESPNERPSPAALNRLFHQHNCRVLEVDELEQADLLSRVWKPDALIIDETLYSRDSRAYLEELSRYHYLAALPLVTLDLDTARAANELKHADGTPKLKVFPCLASPELCEGEDSPAACTLPAVLQVIQVAARFNDR
ncbi:MAG: ATP-binding protein [Cyanobacteriota bacterium]|nr:ATP-binding protein [Cyanobacteriota bacterium]